MSSVLGKRLWDRNVIDFFLGFFLQGGAERDRMWDVFVLCGFMFAVFVL